MSELPKESGSVCSTLERGLMPAETLKALKGSIEKWEKIAAGTGVDRGGENCPLCQLFVLANDDCEGCPVMAKTGVDDCTGTPYSEWHRANPWPEDEDGRFARERAALTPQHQALAQKEADFLKSLLPPGEKP